MDGIPSVLTGCLSGVRVMGRAQGSFHDYSSRLRRGKKLGNAVLRVFMRDHGVTNAEYKVEHRDVSSRSEK